jgi:hypothetical protein
MSFIHEDDSVFLLMAPSTENPPDVQMSRCPYAHDPVIVEGCAPTEIESDDCAETELDSDHDGSPDIAIADGHWWPLVAPEPDGFALSLCALLEQSLPPAVKEESSEEQWDTQLTDNDNPGLPDRALPVPLPLHWTIDPLFWESYFYRIESYMEDDWFDQSDCLNFLKPPWEQNCELVTDAIQSIVSRCTEFKIGITLDPRYRFFRCAFGEYSKRFSNMTIVYTAPFSRPHKLHSTGMMETIQIAKFKSRTGCLNVAPGGEGASAGSPHFLYVVSN